MIFDFDRLPRAFPTPPCAATVRAFPEDFFVDEMLSFEPSGEGEHVLLHVEKRDCTTEWVVRRIARAAGVSAAAVGYAGRKDRRAVARQWFSVALAGRPEPGWSGDEGWRVLESVRHARKLRVGALRGNRFVLRLRRVVGDRGAVAGRVRAVAARGVPNYFGPQRFGIDGANVSAADALLRGRRRERDRGRRGMLYSAARGWLFNRVLARRVAHGTWERALPGEALMLDGSRSFFTTEAPDEAIVARVGTHDVHPTGPLCGRGTPPVRGEVGHLESDCLAPWAAWTEALAQAGLDHDRRALRVPVRGVAMAWDGPDLVLELMLPAGAYATSALREVTRVRG